MKKHCYKDSGFSLVEVVFAMVLLGVLAVATLPLITTGMALAAKNEDRAHASMLINEEIYAFRKYFPSDDESHTGDPGSINFRYACTQIRQNMRFESVLNGYKFSRQGTYMVTGVATPCPTSFPDTVTLTFSVYKLATRFNKNSADSEPILTVDTKIMVTK